jgi:hypothetical protein
MPLNFPSSPATSTTYTFNNKTWTYNGNAWALSSGGALNTSVVPEGINLYFSNARARAAISVSGSGSYDNSTGIITITGGVSSVGGATGAVSNAQLASGISNATISNITLTGNVSTGNVSVTGSSRLGTVTFGTWNGNSISTSYTDAKIASVSNTAPISATTSGNAVTVGMLSSGVTAATYGNATLIPSFVVDQYGRITSASNIAVSTTVANSSITGNIIASQLQPTGVTASTYGGASSIPAITIDAQGRITSASNVAVSAGVTASKSLAFSLVFGS